MATFKFYTWCISNFGFWMKPLVFHFTQGYLEFKVHKYSYQLIFFLFLASDDAQWAQKTLYLQSFYIATFKFYFCTWCINNFWYWMNPLDFNFHRIVLKVKIEVLICNMFPNLRIHEKISRNFPCFLSKQGRIIYWDQKCLFLYESIYAMAIEKFLYLSSLGWHLQEYDFRMGRVFQLWKFSYLKLGLFRNPIFSQKRHFAERKPDIFRE